MSINKLCNLCRFGKLDEIKDLFFEYEKIGIKVNSLNYKGMNALSCAASMGRFNVVKYLIEKQKVDVNILCNERAFKRNALHFAAIKSEPEIVKILVKNGIKKNVNDAYGRTPKSYAKNKEIKQIIECGKKKRYIKYPGEDSDSDEEKEKKKIKKRVKKSKKMSRIDRIIKASRNGNIQDICKLVETVDVNCVCENSTYKGFTPLCIATFSDQLETVKFLIEKCKADVNFTASGHLWNRTSLHFAAERGNIEMAKYLISKGSIKEIQDTFYKRAVDIVKSERMYALLMYGNEDVFYQKKDNGLSETENSSKTLLKECKQFEPEKKKISKKEKIENFVELCRNGKISRVKYKLKKGYKYVNEYDSKGRLGICVAARYNKLKTLRLLIEKGEADINGINEDTGYTALHYASKNNHFDVVKYLLEKGIDTEIKGYFGKTAYEITKNEEMWVTIVHYSKIKQLENTMN